MGRKSKKEGIYVYVSGEPCSIPGLEKSAGEGIGSHSSILAETIPWTEEPGGLYTVHGAAKSGIWLSDTTTILWKDWCWSWSSDTLATWYKELTHWKRLWCWERLKAGGEGDDRGWDGWIASLTQWTWVWADSRKWWRTGKPGVLQSMGSQRITWQWLNNHKTWRWGYSSKQARVVLHLL